MRLFKAVCLAFWLWTNAATASEIVEIEAYTKYGDDALFEVLIKFDIEPGWHVFAPYEQDFGLPLSVKWTLPKAAKIWENSFSRPQSYDFDGFRFDGYEQKLFYKATIKNVNPADELTAKVYWQACKNECLSREKTLILKPQNTRNFGNILQEAQKSFADDEYAPRVNWWIVLAMAFGGGLLLNLMPCVLPILSIKIIALANVKKATRQKEAWYYSLGVVVSMLAVAAVLSLMRMFDPYVGWGFQMQSPLFVAVMLLVFIVLSLMMLDIISLNSRWISKLAELRFEGVRLNAFMTGLLAVLVATPCSAPLMGAAIGYALMAPYYVYFPVFLALAVGYALPFAWLAYYPKLLRKILPKPGKWMIRLKKILSIPLVLTCVWLAWILAAQLGLISSGKYAKWQDYSAEAVEDALSRRQPVLIDFTAKWCLTCLMNKQTVLQDDDFIKMAKEKNILLLRADITTLNPQAAAGLKYYGRESVPLYIYYTGESNDYVILPQILTPQILKEYLQ